MESASAMQRCARCLLSPSSSRTILISSNAPLLVRQQPMPRRLPSTRHLSTSQSAHDAPTPSKSEATATPAQRPSIKDLLRDLRAREEPRSGQTVNDRMDALMGRRQNSARGAGRANFADIMGRRAGTGGSGGGFDQNKMLDELSQELHETSSIALRLRPTLGRTVDGVNGNPSRGFQILERKCAVNKIKSDARKQLFHVRRGQAKKDIRRSRWRKLFLEGFIAECGRVRRMRNQGW